jgi:hypothetical protein
MFQCSWNIYHFVDAIRWCEIGAEILDNVPAIRVEVEDPIVPKP